jgi:hypothetical protein
MRLLIFLTSSTIVSLGAKQNSRFPETGCAVEVKRTVSYVLLLYPIDVSDVSFFQLRVRFVSAHTINFGTEKMSYTTTNHKYRRRRGIRNTGA